MRNVCAAVVKAHSVRLAATQRGGPLAIGELAVVVAAGARHRGVACAAAQEFIATIKSVAPIWKHQALDDDTTEWVGTP